MIQFFLLNVISSPLFVAPESKKIKKKKKKLIKNKK